MKTRRLLTLLTFLLLTPASAALADAGVRQDNSQYLVWAFLGMCALIVIVQLVPVAVLAYGLVKGLLQGKAKEDAAAHQGATHK
jgi:hypothetical protein